MSVLDPITLNVGAVYKDEPKTLPGFTTYVDGEVDTNTAGVYTITYTLIKLEPSFETETWTREVTVTSAPNQIGSITLSGDPVITVSLPDIASYVDAGATSPDGTVLVTNLDGTASESFTGLPNIAGSYTLIYYLSGSLSNFVTRTIHVSDPNSGGGGGGVSAPASGPTGLDASIVSTPPASGPTGLDASIVSTPPSSGPTGLDAVLEAEPVKPAVGYPIVSLEDTTPSAPPTDPAVKPAAGYAVTSLEDTTPPENPPDPAVKPTTGYPIESIEM